MGGAGADADADVGSTMVVVVVVVSAGSPLADTGVGWRPSRRALEMSAALHFAYRTFSSC